MEKPNKIEFIPIEAFAEYEIHSCVFTKWISNDYLQKLIGKYFAWKVKRKYARYIQSLKEREWLLERSMDFRSRVQYRMSKQKKDGNN